MEIKKMGNGVFEIHNLGAVIGRGSMIEDEGGDCYLEGIEIDEEHRNQGHGTEALKELRKVYGEYILAADNEAAARLYERVADKMRQSEYDSFGFAIDQGYGVFVM